MAGFSGHPQQQQHQGGGGGGGAHGLQLIRESLGSWTSEGNGYAAGGVSARGDDFDDDSDDYNDPRLRESLDGYARSRDGLRRELTAMTGELAQERSSWSTRSGRR